MGQKRFRFVHRLAKVAPLLGLLGCGDIMGPGGASCSARSSDLIYFTVPNDPRTYAYDIGGQVCLRAAPSGEQPSVVEGGLMLIHLTVFIDTTHLKLLR